MSQSYLSNSKKSDTSSTSSTISNTKNLNLASDSIKKAQRDIQTGNLAGANTSLINTIETIKKSNTAVRDSLLKKLGLIQVDLQDSINNGNDNAKIYELSDKLGEAGRTVDKTVNDLNNAESRNLSLLQQLTSSILSATVEIGKNILDAAKKTQEHVKELKDVQEGATKAGVEYINKYGYKPKVLNDELVFVDEDYKVLKPEELVFYAKRDIDNEYFDLATWDEYDKLTNNKDSRTRSIGTKLIEAMAENGEVTLGITDSDIEAGLDYYKNRVDQINYDDKNGTLNFNVDGWCNRDAIEVIAEGYYKKNDQDIDWNSLDLYLWKEGNTNKNEYLQGLLLNEIVKDGDLRWNSTDDAFRYFESKSGTYGIDQGVFNHVTWDYTNSVYDYEKKEYTVEPTKVRIENDEIGIAEEHMMDVYGLDEHDAALYVSMINSKGVCAYAAQVNGIYNQFINNPKEFEEIFGFPMYRTDSKGQVALNGGELLVDYYAYMNSSVTGRKTINKKCGWKLFNKPRVL